MLHGLRGGDGLDERLRVGEADVLRRVDDQPAHDEPRVLPASIIRASQKSAASGSEPRIDLMNALITS